MKRFGALVLALMMLASAAFAEITSEEEASIGGMKILRTHERTTNDFQEVVIDYPVFECSDAQLQAFLTENITDVIQRLRASRPLAEESAYADGSLDSVRGGFYASLDFAGLLSVEASVRNQAAGSEEEEIHLFYSIVDLNGRRIVDIQELFNEPAAVVAEVICTAVYDKVSEMGVLLPAIKDSGYVPMPDSYYLTKDVLRVLYRANTLCNTAFAMDLPWDELPLTQSALMSQTVQATPEPTAVPQPLIIPAPESTGIIGGADGPTAIFIAEDAKDVPEEITAMLEATLSPMPTVTPFPVETLNPE